MSVQGLTPIPLEIFSGMVPDMAPSDIPPGASPGNNDCAFFLGSVKSRPGLGTGAFPNSGTYPFVGNPMTGNPTVNYQKTFTDQNFANRLLMLDSLGNLWQENPQNTIALLATVVPGSFCRSTTQYGEEFLCFHDGKFGIDMPRRYDTVNFDRVSQVGPGEGPGTPPGSVGDSAAPAALNIAAAPNGAIRTNNVLTVTLAAAPAIPLVAGENVALAGITDGTMNVASIAILTVDPSGTILTFQQNGANSNSGNGTLTVVPQIAAGLHQVAVAFQTRSGAITRLSPPSPYNAAGGRYLQITANWSFSPANVTNVIVSMTGAGGASYFHTQAMVFSVLQFAGTIYIDVSDAALLSGTNDDGLFRQVELGECAGTIDYADRQLYWGERAKVQNFANLSFDGAFRGDGAPTGWLFDATYGNGGQAGGPAKWGFSWQMNGDGLRLNRGMIVQGAWQDAFGVPRLLPSTAYSVRVSLLAGNGPNNGTVNIEIFSASKGSLGIFTVQANAVGAANFVEYSGALMAARLSIPSDAVLRLYLGGTPEGTTQIFADNIEIYQTNAPNFDSQLRVSFNSNGIPFTSSGGPEAFDGVSGRIVVAQENGQRVTNAFKIRQTLYPVKERSFYSTADDGSNEPAKWVVDEVSNLVGTPSVQGVGVGTEWVVIAGRQGAYIFYGTTPTKISQEIQKRQKGTLAQASWNDINWQFGHRLWCIVDENERRILIGAPTFGSQVCNTIFYFDYRGMDTPQEIANHYTVRYSQYSGKILAIGDAPKWSSWNITAASATLAERSDGTTHTFIGNGIGNGKVYDLLDTNFSDDGVGIPFSYSTYFFPSHQDEMQYKLGSNRKNFGYLTGLVRGSGSLKITAQQIGNLAPVPVGSVAMVDPDVTVAIATIVRVNGLTTVTCAAAHGLTAGTDTNVTIQGTADATFNNTFPILRIVNAAVFTIYQGGLPDSNLGAGGSIVRVLRDFEFMTNFSAERALYTFSNSGNAAGTWFQLEKLVPYMQPDPWAPVRGTGVN